MALAGIPPWLNPPDFVGASRAGAALGLEGRGQDIQVAEAGDRLKLAYDQLEAQEKRDAVQEAAKLALAHATLQMKKDQMTALDRYRQQNIEAQNLRAQDRLSLSAQRLEDLNKYRSDTEALRRELAGKEPTGTFPLDPNNPFGPKVTGQLSRPEIAPLYQAATAVKPAAPEPASAPGPSLTDYVRAAANLGGFGLGGRLLSQSPAAGTTNAPALAPTAGQPLVTPKGVRVKSKDGKFGYVPPDQVEDALTEGYTLAPN